MTAAVTAACATTLVVTLSPVPPALADPAPDFPTAEQVEAAKQAAAAKKGEVGAIEAQLALADRKLDQIAFQVSIALEAYLAAVYQLDVAEQAAADATARAKEADVAVESARDELGRFASASYRIGGDLAALSALLDADGPKGLADQAAALDNVATQRGRSYDRFRGAKIAADVLRTISEEALAEQQRATDLVRASKEAAERELANQQVQVEAIEQQKAQLTAQLAQLRDTSTTLERQRQEGLAREAARRAAEEAARRAAEEAARRAAAEAARQAAEARRRAAGAAAQAAQVPRSSAPSPDTGGRAAGCSSGADLSGYANGRIATSLLCPLWGAPGHRLRSDAAAAYNRLSQAYASRFGSPLCITDSYRSYEAQVILKRLKGYLAAMPGTSQHGLGIAVDLCGGVQSFSSIQHTWMRNNAPDFGFVLPSWARENGSKPEPWHWEYVG